MEKFIFDQAKIKEKVWPFAVCNLYKILKKLFIYFPIYIIHVFILLNGPSLQFMVTHLHWLMPLAGGIFLIKNKSILYPFIPVVILFLLSLFQGLMVFDMMIIQRSTLAILMFAFAHFLYFEYQLEDFIKLAIAIIIITVLYYIYTVGFIQYINPGFFPHLKKTIFSSYRLIRLDGPLGFSNHNAMMLIILSIVLFLEDKKKLALLAIGLSLFNLSRSVLFITCLVYFLFYLQSYLNQKKRYQHLYFILAMTFIFPLLVYTSGHYLSDLKNTEIDKLTSGRYSIQYSYLKIFKSHPLGVGFSKSLTAFTADQKNDLSSDHLSNFEKHNNIIGDPHNLYIRILVEFGILGFLVFWGWLFWLIQLGIKREKFIPVVAFVAIHLAYLTMDPLFDFSYYFFLAYYLKSIEFSFQEFHFPFLKLAQKDDNIL